MAEFVNTIDGLGDEVVADMVISRTITEYRDSQITVLAPRVFTGCSQLRAVAFPNLTTVGGWTFLSCSALEIADLGVTKHSSAFQTFVGCTSLKALVLRGNTVATLDGSSYLSNTLIGSGTGYIYVPRALLSDYASATNFSNFAEQFRALEDYTVDGTITGDLDESKI